MGEGLITRGLQDIIIVPGKASREKVYLTVNEDWYGDPKCFDNISECEAYINQQNKHTLKLEKIIE